MVGSSLLTMFYVCFSMKQFEPDGIPKKWIAILCTVVCTVISLYYGFAPISVASDLAFLLQYVVYGWILYPKHRRTFIIVYLSYEVAELLFENMLTLVLKASFDLSIDLTRYLVIVIPVQVAIAVATVLIFGKDKIASKLNHIDLLPKETKNIVGITFGALVLLSTLTVAPYIIPGSSPEIINLVPIVLILIIFVTLGLLTYLVSVSLSRLYADANIDKMNNQIAAQANLYEQKVDALMIDKDAIATKEGITFDFYGDFPQSGFDPIDLVAVFGNAIDNAIEALCETESNLPKEIIVSSKILNGNVYISFKNTLLKPVTIVNNHIATTKENPAIHGFGLYSIQKTAEKYDGFMTLQTDNDWFVCNVMMKLEKNGQNR